MTAFEVTPAGYTPAATSPDAAKRAPITEVTRACDLCGAEVTGKSRGTGSVNWKMSLHKRQVHGIEGTSRRSKKAPTPEDYDRHPVASIAADMASEIKSTTGAPKKDELAAALARGFGLANYIGASFAVESDRYMLPEARESTIAELTLPEDDLKAIMQPIGKLMAGTKLNAKYGRTVVEHVDMIGAVGALGQVGFRWVTYIRGRREAAAIYGAQAAQMQATGQIAPSPAPLSIVPPHVEPGTVYVPSVADQPVRPDLANAVSPDFGGNASAGYVVTAADVAAMQQRGA